MQSYESVKYQAWSIEFDPTLKVDFDDESDFNDQLDMQTDSWAVCFE